MNISPGSICRRLREVRLKHFGPRGKAPFARALGIRASTYHHYEIDRSPPAELLARASQLTRTRIEWLLTGTGDMDDLDTGSETNEVDLALTRLRRLLTRQPRLYQNVIEFLKLMESAPIAPPGEPARAVTASESTADLIPVVGSTAAGPARFWSELNQTLSGEEANRRLDELLSQHTQRAVCQASLESFDIATEPDSLVSLVQFSHPDDLGFIEFLSCPAAKSKHPSCLAWRIDGDSMKPRYNDGDLVITSPDVSAVEGHACVVHQQGQIGVNCKIFQREDQEVVLIPVNEAFPTQRFPARELAWGQRVLYSVRLATSR